MVAKQRDEDHETGRTRTTLTLGNDALRLIRRRAEASGQTLGAAATALILEAGQQPDSEDEEPLPPYVFPPRPGEPPVTMELVNRLRDELL